MKIPPPSASETPRGTWMFAGLEEMGASPDVVDRPDVLRSAAILGIRGAIRHVAYVPHSGCIYYTTPQAPFRIMACYVPFGRHPRTERARVSGERAMLEPSFVDLPNDVLALAAGRHELWAVTATRPVRQSSSITSIVRILVDPNTAFLWGERRSYTLLLPNQLKGGEQLSVAVLADAETTTIFVSGGKSTALLTGAVSHAQRIDLQPCHLGDQPYGVTSGDPLVLTQLPRTVERGAEAAYPGLLAGDPTSGQIDEFHEPRHATLSVRLSLAGESADIYPLAAAGCRLDLAYAWEPYGERLPFNWVPHNLVVNRRDRAIWRVNLDGKIRLIGGGTQPPSQGAPSNLLDLDLERTDSLCSVGAGSLLFGERDTTQWWVLLLPRQASALGLDGFPSMSDWLNQQPMPRTTPGTLESA